MSPCYIPSNESAILSVVAITRGSLHLRSEGLHGIKGLDSLNLLRSDGVLIEDVGLARHGIESSLLVDIPRHGSEKEERDEEASESISRSAHEGSYSGSDQTHGDVVVDDLGSVLVGLMVVQEVKD